MDKAKQSLIIIVIISSIVALICLIKNEIKEYNNFKQYAISVGAEDCINAPLGDRYTCVAIIKAIKEHKND